MTKYIAMLMGMISLGFMISCGGGGSAPAVVESPDGEEENPEGGGSVEEGGEDRSEGKLDDASPGTEDSRGNNERPSSDDMQGIDGSGLERFNLASSHGDGELFQKAQGIWSRVDSLYSTDIQFYHHRYYDYDFWAFSRCRGTTRCSYENEDAGYSSSIDASEDELTPRTVRSSFRYGGVPIETFTYGYDGVRVEGIWSVLNYSGFESIDADFNDYDYSARYSISAGDSTGSLPSFISASYGGAMTGVLNLSGDLLVGDAILRYRTPSSGEVVDIEFSNIRNVTKNRLVTWTLDSFVDIPVYPDGGFLGWDSEANSGWYIEGEFYGPNHEEATGVFEDWFRTNDGLVDSLLGAFGTKKGLL